MKKTIILLLCAIFFLSACGPEGGNQVSVTEIEEGIPSSEAEEEEKNSMLNENNSYELQEQIVSARIEDVTEGAYQEELSVMLSEEEVPSLLDLSGGLYAGEMHSGSRKFFCGIFSGCRWCNSGALDRGCVISGSVRGWRCVVR